MMTALRDACSSGRGFHGSRPAHPRRRARIFAPAHLSEVLKSAEDAQASLASARRLGELYIAMRRHPKPVICAVMVVR